MPEDHALTADEVLQAADNHVTILAHLYALHLRDVDNPDLDLAQRVDQAREHLNATNALCLMLYYALRVSRMLGDWYNESEDEL